MKKCSVCKIEKPINEFGLDKRKLDGHKYNCRKCHNESNRAYRKANPEKHRKTNLDYMQSARGQSVQRSNNLRRKFWPHMTNEQAIAEYNRLLAAQNNCCGLCGKHQSEFKVALSVDHDHGTGKARGLLCNKCNRFEVGRHTLESARKMLAYFELYK